MCILMAQRSWDERLGQGAGIGVLVTTMVLLSASAAIVGPTHAQTSNLGNVSEGSTENLEKNFSANRSINLTCRNDKCEPGLGEDVYNCPEDCGVCGDDICDTTEDRENCMEDCLCQGPVEAAFGTNPTSPTWLDNTTLNASGSQPHPECLTFDWEGDDGIDKEAGQGEKLLYHNFTSATAWNTDTYPPDANVERKCWPLDGQPVYPPQCGYVVTLEVEEVNDGVTSSVTKRIDIGGRGDPYPVLEVGSEPKIKEYPITFDASESYDTAGPDGGTGEIVQYDFHWGHDDEKCIDCGQTLTHEFPSIGEYDVTLNVTDNNGQWRAVTTEVDIDPNQPPEGELEATPDEAPTGKIVPYEDITFDATDYEDPEDQGAATPDLGVDSYDWDLDDDGDFEIIDGDVTERGSFDDTDAGENGGCVRVRVTDTRGASTIDRKCFDVHTTSMRTVTIKKTDCGRLCCCNNPEFILDQVRVFTVEEGDYAVRVNGDDRMIYLQCNGKQGIRAWDDCTNHPDDGVGNLAAVAADWQYFDNKATDPIGDFWTKNGRGDWSTMAPVITLTLIKDTGGVQDRWTVDLSAQSQGQEITYPRGTSRPIDP